MGFDREMEGVDWEEVCERQVARGGLADRYCELLQVSAGDRVVELGCGPGYAAGELARRLSPGVVIAVDRRPGAVRYLRENLDRPNVWPVCGDVAAIPLRFGEPTAALAAFLLHHAEEPRQLLTGVASALPAGSRLLVVEYHPDSPGEFGPPTEARLAPDRVEVMLSDAGFTGHDRFRLPEEKYGIVSRRV